MSFLLQTHIIFYFVWIVVWCFWGRPNLQNSDVFNINGFDFRDFGQRIFFCMCFGFICNKNVALCVFSIQSMRLAHLKWDAAWSEHGRWFFIKIPFENFRSLNFLYTWIHSFWYFRVKFSHLHISRHIQRDRCEIIVFTVKSHLNFEMFAFHHLEKCWNSQWMNSATWCHLNWIKTILAKELMLIYVSGKRNENEQQREKKKRRNKWRINLLFLTVQLLTLALYVSEQMWVELSYRDFW